MPLIAFLRHWFPLSLPSEASSREKKHGNNSREALCTLTTGSQKRLNASQQQDQRGSSGVLKIHFPILWHQLFTETTAASSQWLVDLHQLLLSTVHRRAACLKTFRLHFVSCCRHSSVEDPPMTLQQSVRKPETITISLFPLCEGSCCCNTWDQFTWVLPCQTRLGERMLTLAWSTRLL